MNSRQHEAFFPVGVIQTTTDADIAWREGMPSPAMSDIEDDYAWYEITKAMRTFQDGGLKPQLILLPELALPRTRLRDFEHLVAALNVIAVAGVDYQLDRKQHRARNQGIVFIPRGFFRGRPSRYCTKIIFGKTFPAPMEKQKLKQLRPSWSFEGDPNVYVFDCENYGSFGVSICYDFMDIERALMYRGRIHHLFVLAYNRDMGMFRSLADSLSRTVFCNVVICNTGHYGGSVIVSPYYEAFRRTLYTHEGRKLFTTQVVQLPVHGLHEARRSQAERIEVRTMTQEFKEPPPGYPQR